MRNIYADVDETATNTLGVYLVTTRPSQSFAYAELKITLQKSSIQSYYVLNESFFSNCEIGHNITLRYESSQFTFDPVDKGRTKTLYIFSEYPDKLCPLSTYAWSVVVFNTTGGAANPSVDGEFDTRKKKKLIYKLNNAILGLHNRFISDRLKI